MHYNELLQCDSQLIKKLAKSMQSKYLMNKMKRLYLHLNVKLWDKNRRSFCFLKRFFSSVRPFKWGCGDQIMKSLVDNPFFPKDENLRKYKYGARFACLGVWYKLWWLKHVAIWMNKIIRTSSILKLNILILFVWWQRVPLTLIVCFAVGEFGASRLRELKTRGARVGFGN